MIILGIDPGTAITGYGVIETVKSNIVYHAHGVIRTKSSQNLTQRLYHIYKGIISLIKKYNPESVAVEEIYFSKNARTALSVGHARGVVLLSAVNSGVEVREYTPLQVKQAVAGYGRANKIQIQKMVKNILALNDLPSPDDAADALAVAICHANSYKLNNLTMNR